DDRAGQDRGARASAHVRRRLSSRPRRGARQADRHDLGARRTRSRARGVSIRVAAARAPARDHLMTRGPFRALVLGAIGAGALVVTPAAIADTALRPSVALAAPAPASIPSGPLGDSIRLGQRIVTDTQSVVKAYVGNGLTCANCHLDAGRQAYAAPLVGLTGLFPEFESRSASGQSLEERLNDWLVGSMNGRKLPSASSEMVALLAYIAWLSQGVPTGAAVTGRGFKDIA